jgi:hypothetical protein
MPAAGNGGGYKHHHHNKPVQEFSDNFAFDRKIKESCIGLKPCTQSLLLELHTDEDKELIADSITQWSNQYCDGRMMSPGTKREYITSLAYLSRYVNKRHSGGQYKAFKQMTHEDILDGYLRSQKREFKDDPDEKWINTHKIL